MEAPLERPMKRRFLFGLPPNFPRFISFFSNHFSSILALHFPSFVTG
jgi:hypothetical protein